MSELEMTKLCAQALGAVIHPLENSVEWDIQLPNGVWIVNYDPLHDDAQPMALVKKFELDIARIGEVWSVYYDSTKFGKSIDLNCAIVECVAKLQERK